MRVALAALDATAQAQLVKSGDFSPVELVNASISSIEQINPQLNAVICPLFDKAINTARQLEQSPHRGAAVPFRGVPMLLKDILCHSAGDPYMQGMGLLKDLGWVEQYDTYLAAKLRSAGFVFMGKTNTSELGLQVLTEPEAFGPTLNPWSLSHSTGGSSGGSAAAVASGMVPVAHGTDGGGSIRIPASACGLVGLKPTRGRTSLGPDIWEVVCGVAVEHVLTRSVRDSAAILDAVAGPMPGDPYAAVPPSQPFLTEVGANPGRLHIGMLRISPEWAEPMHPDCRRAVNDAADLLASLGHHVEESNPHAVCDPGIPSKFLVIWSVIAAVSLKAWSEATGVAIGSEHVEPLTWALAERGRAHSAADLVAAESWLGANARRQMTWWDEGHDVLLTATLAVPPPRLGELSPSPDDPLEALERQLSIIPFTPPANITGQPAISLPLSWNKENLPIGIQLVGAYGREDALFRVAAQLETARPWADRLPPVRASSPAVIRKGDG